MFVRAGSMYELVDHWSHDVSEKEYVRFLMALFRRVCEPVADNTAGYGSPVLKMLAPGEYTHTQDTHTRIRAASLVRFLPWSNDADDLTPRHTDTQRSTLWLDHEVDFTRRVYISCTHMQVTGRTRRHRRTKTTAAAVC